MKFRINKNITIGILSFLVACFLMCLGRVLIGLLGLLTSVQLIRDGLKIKKKRTTAPGN